MMGSKAGGERRVDFWSEIIAEEGGGGGGRQSLQKKKQPIYQSRRRQTPHQIQITSTRCQLVMLNDKDSSFIISGFSNSIYSSNSTPLFLSFFSFLFSSSASKVQKERRDCWKRFLDRRLGLA
uniref:Uncharacterized protein n=1 Tax=Populus trichocarpa TaxID=3694 RepID=A0A3N7FUM8_POPTR